MRTRMLTIGSQKVRTAIWPGRGTHIPLFFFNGIGANLELITPLAEAMDCGDLIAFDVPGTGLSPPARLPYRPWQLARLANRLLEQLGYDEVDVMGVSWGGGIAQQFAFQYSDRTRRLILAATSAGVIMVPGKLSAITKMMNPRRYIDPEFMFENFEALYGDHQEHAKDHNIRIIPPTRRGYYMQLAAMAGWTSVPFLPFLKAPTLILSGLHDRIVPISNGKLLNFLIPNSELKVINGGHLFIITRADEVIPVIGEFLDEWGGTEKASA